MVKYSFNADMSCVFERLAVTHRGTPAPSDRAESPRNATRVIPFEPAKPQPRIEIAHAALRPSHGEPREAVT